MTSVRYDRTNGKEVMLHNSQKYVDTQYKA